MQQQMQLCKRNHSDPIDRCWPSMLPAMLAIRTLRVDMLCCQNSNQNVHKPSSEREKQKNKAQLLLFPLSSPKNCTRHPIANHTRARLSLLLLLLLLGKKTTKITPRRSACAFLFFFPVFYMATGSTTIMVAQSLQCPNATAPRCQE